MVNKVFLIGNCGKDPEVRYTTNGTPKATFSLATSEKYNDKETTSWHNVVAWGKLAEIVNKYVVKGKQLCIIGKIDYQTWEKDGVKHYRTDIVASEMKLLGGTRSEQRETVKPATEEYDIGDLGPPIDFDNGSPLSPGD